MKKTALLIASAFLFSTTAHAHRVWVETVHTHGGEYLEAELGYGKLPELEPIAKDRLHIFNKPIQLVTEKGKENMIQKGTHNYQHRSELPVKDGNYSVIAEYQPIFWSKNSAGWKQASIKEMSDTSYCEQTRMSGKNTVNIGYENADTAIITKQVGQHLEIVPLDNPANVHVGEHFKVRVPFNGEPLPNAAITATFDGFDTSNHSKTHKTEAQVFSGTTDDKGGVSIISLCQGFWEASIEYEADFPDRSVCQKQANYTTLTFQIGHSHH